MMNTPRYTSSIQTASAHDDEIARLRLSRELAYKLGEGEPMYVMDHRPAAAFPAVGFDPMESYPLVAQGLQQLSRDFVLVFDPHTKRINQSTHCGIHLYSRFCGLLLHETSCQWHMDKPWGEGRPCSPVQCWNGRGLVAWVKAHLKARLPGDPEHIQREINQQTRDYNDRKRQQFDNEALELDRYLAKEKDRIERQVVVGFS